MSSNIKQLMLAALSGAAVSAAVVVLIYEGRTPETQVTANPTSSAQETPPAAPSLESTALSPYAKRTIDAITEEKDALLTRVDTLEKDLALARSVTLAGAVKADPEVAQLKRQIELLQQALDEEHAQQAVREGEALPFPDDLPEAYTEAGLRQAFTDMLAAQGIHGEISEIDCSEFPCIVHGEAEDRSADRNTINQKFDALNDMIDERYPKDEASHSASIWGSTTKDEQGEPLHKNSFSFSVYPKADQSEEDQTAIRKRLRFRNQQRRDLMEQEKQ
ncbi:MAG: hypothetical protein ACE366_07450 [Bradymonadia bacterium]